ncbi:MAG TPA: hypothetical protein VF020_15830 [Chthoniobacterales bacterium]
MNPFGARTWLVLTVALAGLAQIVASFCLMVLTWDGAGYVFNTIQRGHAAVPNSRYSDYPLLAVVSLFSFLINDSCWLARIYGLLLAVLPLGSLLLSFHFLSGPQQKGLRVWPVLGILLSVLPGQAFLVAEAVAVAQVSWAVWAMAAADISISSLVWLGMLNLFLFFLHPSSALVYAVSGGLFVGKAWMATSQRRSNAWLGAMFLGLAAVRLWYALATANSYERGEESFSQNYLAFRDALPSLRMLPVVYLLGLTVLGGVTRRIPKRYLMWLAGLELALLLVYGVAWAADPKVWVSAFTFRRFVLVGALPLVVMGGWHWRYEQAARIDDSSEPSDHRLGWIMAGSATVFFIVFATQSFSWRQELSRFEVDLNRCDKPVATITDLPWVADSPLHHWASTQLSCVVQGKKVKTVFAPDLESVRENKILLFPGTWFRRRNQWFEFEQEWSVAGTK